MSQIQLPHDTTTLHNILKFQGDWLSTSLSLPLTNPHQTFLTWLFKTTHPETIGIFDASKKNASLFLNILAQTLNISCQCYASERSCHPLFTDTTIPLTSETPLSFFSLIYVDISNQSIENTPILSGFKSRIPANSILVFSNLYSQNFIAKENRIFIKALKQNYPFFELSHHQGLLALYTGSKTPVGLTELFALKNTPQLEQTFKTYCATLDEYRSLKKTQIETKSISNKTQIVEAKTETYLLEQEIYYRDKKNKIELAEAQNTIATLQDMIAALQATLDLASIQLNTSISISNSYVQQLKTIHSAYTEQLRITRHTYQEQIQESYNTLADQLKITAEAIRSEHLKAVDAITQEFGTWHKSNEDKINSLQYLLNKHRFLSFFIPKKIKNLLNFAPLPNPSQYANAKEIKVAPTLIAPAPLFNAPPSSIPIEFHPEVTPFVLPSESIAGKTITKPSEQRRIRHILFIAGEPNTPGVIYRCYRNAAACAMAGHEAKVVNAANVTPEEIVWADVLILWRVEFSGHILGIIDIAKEHHTLTAFDADDIVFKPHFAYIEIIDGIRTIGTTEAETSRTFGNMKQTLMRSDFAVATTQEMREHMAQELIPKHAGPLVFTLPNIFDDDCVRVSRFFSRIKKANKSDDFIRIGYASGTRTHQRDFALVVPALLSIFKKRPQVKLVLFREPENHRPILHMNEFPELGDYQDRIEWRDTVPLKQLPQELARLDISIAPLEADNVFCNAKSELKFFEAALANVCSVVSPTGPLSRCVQQGITGFLASNDEEWENHLLQLIDDPTLRQTMAQKAYHDVLWNFSMQRQSHLCDTMLLSLTDEKSAAQAMETMIARKEYKNLGMPDVPESEILFEHDALQEAEVTVIITSYNYSQFIIEAMETVKAQTLKHIDMIIVDDGSSDDSIELILTWAKEHKSRFNRLQLHRSLKNVGLGGARNIGIAASETLYSMQLDADNRLLPDTCEKLLEKMQDTAIGYAYPHLRHFGAGEATGGHIPFHPLRLTVGNYIDAMVMVSKWAWAAAGGYYVQRDAMGWEDYDLWCRLAELGIQGTQVQDAIAEYRAHFSSMTNTVTEQTYHKPKVTSYLAKRHPWIKLVLPEESPWLKKTINR